jgi:MYXO-CTERM domain-containing protein
MKATPIHWFVAFLALLLAFPAEAKAQPTVVDLTHYVGPNYSNSSISYCGATTKKFRVAYDYYWGCPVGLGQCGPYGTCGANPYRMTATLYSGNTPLSTQTFQGSAAWSVFTFNNVTLQPGSYTAVVKLEKRNWTCVGWQTVKTTTSNLIVASAQAATPSFTINGIVPPKDGSPIDVCASLITMDAAATSCESNYFITIQESDQWWNRTYQYEVDKWFSGQAPNGLNLQQIATTWSYPPYFTGPVSRQGNALFSGNLPAAGERFYRVGLCTAEPTWTCQSALINVDGNCKVLDPPTEDAEAASDDGACSAATPDGSDCGEDRICIAGVCEAAGFTIDDADGSQNALDGAELGGCAVTPNTSSAPSGAATSMAALLGLAVLRRRRQRAARSAGDARSIQAA